ncbi:alpha/beta hydrolase family protein [Massilia endophytica]|uniref:alpha/beta hydrolase family protein n=1 Tax=Massilia endophytica TaxID=2899220 RepID=UPI001E5CFAA5|nr:prolyl oligopeptidase family serine peptidase [Massilia endophytica]UGQ45811.1 prolyl oligopeptidase family serine peptidase [Massilia endophytica]
MFRLSRLALPASILLLSACGGGEGGSGPGGVSLPSGPVASPAPARGSIVTPATKLAAIEPGVMKAALDSVQDGLTAITSTPRCTVTAYSVQYRTAAPLNALSDAGAAIMVPSGSDPNCTGARPVLLYAHGTSLDKTYSMARLSGESQLIAAMFAAQGFIVVAPNYQGYAGSNLGYHPYLDGELQSADMIDALRAARASFPAIGANQSTRLFIAGYSQGAYVALATQKAMQGLAGEFSVTSVAGLSGPYALAQFSDNVFAGNPGQGITAFLPMMTTAAQRNGGAVYTAPGEMYEAEYAAGVENLLPGTLSSSELVKQGKLPETALFASASLPQGAPAYFGPHNLVRTAYRNSYMADAAANACGASSASPLSCAPQNALRKWMVRNDLRSYRPAQPLLLCGGNEDPTVPYANTQSAAAYFQAAGASPTVLDLDTANGLNDRWLVERAGFAAAKLALKADAVSKGQSVSQAMADGYHAGLVAPFCLMAARDFFKASLP